MILCSVHKLVVQRVLSVALTGSNLACQRLYLAQDVFVVNCGCAAFVVHVLQFDSVNDGFAGIVKNGIAFFVQTLVAHNLKAVTVFKQRLLFGVVHFAEQVGTLTLDALQTLASAGAFFSSRTFIAT